MVSDSAKRTCGVGRVCLQIPTGIVEPVSIDSPFSTSEIEADPTRGVVGLQDIDGGLDSRAIDVSFRGGLLDHVPYTEIKRQLRCCEVKI